MTREHKLALILGFALVLVVGVLISDHFSKARSADLEITDLPPRGLIADELATPLDPEQYVYVEPTEPTLGWIEEPLPEPGIGTGPTIITMGDPLALPESIESLTQTTEEPPMRVLDPEPEPEVIRRAVPPTPPAREPLTHVVRPNESLWGIAQANYGNGGLWKELARHNAGVVGKDGSVRTGDRLVMPDRGALKLKSSPPPVKAVAQKKPEPKAQGTYTVKAGDDLGAIAQRLLGTSKAWTKIYDLNRSKLDDPDVIPTGITLVIPSR